MNTQVDLLKRGLHYPEGPFYSGLDGCLYFVEWLGDCVLGYRDGESWLVYQAPAGSGPCGLIQDCQGMLWVCFYSVGELARIDRQGQIRQVFRDWQGEPLKGPNDLVQTPEGGLYFTDSGNYQDDWTNGHPAGSVYYVARDGTLLCAASAIAFPNGIAITPDGRKLYVAEHRRNRILSFDIPEPGVLTNRRVFVELDRECKLPSQRAYELGPDGMCLDRGGHLWVAHYGGGKLIELDLAGQLNQALYLPEGRCPTNLTFDPEEKSLYVTEAEIGLLLRFSI